MQHNAVQNSNCKSTSGLRKRAKTKNKNKNINNILFIISRLNVLQLTVNKMHRVHAVLGWDMFSDSTPKPSGPTLLNVT